MHHAHPTHSPKTPIESSWCRLELLERLGRRLVLLDPKNVESDGFGERSALADSDHITSLDTERRRAVGRQVLVSLLVSAVFGNATRLSKSPAYPQTQHTSGGSPVGQ